MRSGPEEVRQILDEITATASIYNELARWLQEQTNVLNRDLLETLDQTLKATTLLMGRVSVIVRKTQPESGRKALRARIVRSLKKEELKALQSQLESSKETLLSLVLVMRLTDSPQTTLPQTHRIVERTTDSFPSRASLDTQRTFSTNADAQPNNLPSADSDLVDRFLKKLGLRYKRYFNELIFEQNTSYYMKIEQNIGHEPAKKPKLKELKLEILEDIFSNPAGAASTSDDGNPGELLLIVCGASSVVPNTVPFTRDQFITIMNNLGLSPGIFQALYTGFILRTPMSGTENWTLALSWDLEQRALKGIIHGLQSNEVSNLVTYLGDSREDLIHPMSLLVVLCEMLTEGDSNGIKRRATELYQVEIRTNYHGYPRDETIEDVGNAKSPEKDLEEMTRSLNIIISRLAFHEMRIHANAVFTDQVLERIQVVERDPNDLEEGGGGVRHNKLQSASRRLRERLVHLKTEHQALLLEIACNQKIAQSQLEIVYNLVAQRDNKDNLKLAKVSTDIANTTKDDSFTMRIIAVMSIMFLPGTFVSSFFSMDMFNWQAVKGEAVLSSRFWIYWAVTGPLTVSVFAIWFFFLRTHSKHDEYEVDPGSTLPAEIGQLPTAIPKNPRSRAWYHKRWIHLQAKDEEGQPVEETARTSPSLAFDPAEPTPVNRAPTTQVLRVNTIIQGPRR